jgi:hypothetical protein
VKSECARERDVLDAIVAGRWSHDRRGWEREHASSCSVCADLVRVAAALNQESSDLQDVRVPPAGIVWWKAQRRARQEATRAAAQPIRAAQWLAAASAAGVAAAAVGIASPWARGWAAWAVGAAREWHLAEIAAFSETARANTALLMALALPLLLAPVIVYLTVERD